MFLASSNVELTAYNGFVRQQLEYGNIIQNPPKTYLINAPEAMQNKATPFIYHSLMSSIPQLKTEMGLPSSDKRKVVSRLRLFQTLH